MSNFYQKAREPLNSLTHLIGAVLSIIGTAVLLSAVLLKGDAPLSSLLSAGVFGISLIALYSASAVYHYINGSDEKILRLKKLDHSMIYVLIAGTYTPLALSALPQQTGYLFTTIIWAVAIVGILVKIFWISAPRLLSTAFYIVMGWSILFVPSVFVSIQTGALLLVGAGGVSYTIGGVIYFLKKPNISSHFGFHELFHIFVLLGSVLHFFAVFYYLV